MKEHCHGTTKREVRPLDNAYSHLIHRVSNSPRLRLCHFLSHDEIFSLIYSGNVSLSFPFPFSFSFPLKNSRDCYACALRSLWSHVSIQSYLSFLFYFLSLSFVLPFYLFIGCLTVYCMLCW